MSGQTTTGVQLEEELVQLPEELEAFVQLVEELEAFVQLPEELVQSAISKEARISPVMITKLGLRFRIQNLGLAGNRRS